MDFLDVSLLLALLATGDRTIGGIVGTSNATILLALVAHAVIWAGELQLMQSYTFADRSTGGARFEFWAPKIRFVSNLLFAIGWTWLVPTAVLFAVDIGATALYLLLVIYTQFFSRPLSMMSVLYGWREGMRVAPFAWFWWRPFPNGLLVVFLLAKLLVLLVLLPESFSFADRWRFGVAALIAYLALELITLWVDPLKAILTTRGLARLGAIRGYLGPWLAEVYYLNDRTLLNDAQALARMKCDSLTAVEASIPIRDRLVIVQAETLDANVLGLHVEGRPVTPFLNELRERSMYFRVKAVQALGSADADFAALSGGQPARKVLNYNLPKFEYENSLPKLLAEAGYRTEAYHGNWGTFYRRRPAFEKMGFDEIFFREELQSLPGMAVDGLGLRDDSVLSYSSERMSLAKAPTCHFVITLTSHTPYTFVPASSDSLYPHPVGITERYLNHLQYLDDCLRKYVAGLGEDVTFVLYSDHSAKDSSDVFTPCTVGGQDLIPFFIYDGSLNLAAEQRTRDLAAVQGELSLLDVIWYLRNQVRNGRSSATELTPPTVSR